MSDSNDEENFIEFTKNDDDAMCDLTGEQLQYVNRSTDEYEPVELQLK